MVHEGYFDKVYYRFSKTEKTPAATIFAIHGLGGHSLWFDKAGLFFNRQNINFFSFDLPGFGQSKYPIGEIDSYKTWVRVTKDTLVSFLYMLKTSTPFFILGHSMGALIAILLKKNVKSNGWILSVPGFEGYSKTWPLIKFIIPILFKSIFNPHQKIILPFGPELLTKNKKTQIKLKADPYRVINPTANIFKEVYFLAHAAKLNIKHLDEPVLMLMAEEDLVCSNLHMEKYFNQIKSNDKSMKVYTNSYHDSYLHFHFFINQFFRNP